MHLVSVDSVLRLSVLMEVWLLGHSIGLDLVLVLTWSVLVLIRAEFAHFFYRVSIWRQFRDIVYVTQAWIITPILNE